MIRRVLITGGAGFIAHHVIEHLLINTDWQIITIDRLDFSGNLNRLNDMMKRFNVTVSQRLSVIYHDLRSPINSLIANDIGQINYILHLAAGSHVDRSIANPMDFVFDNVVGTTNILDFARQCEHLEHFVYFSTDEVFGPAPSGVSFRERDRYNSTNPYSATKAGGEEMCVAYQNTYRLPIMITHTMNVFGPRQHPEKFIPLCIKKIIANEKIEIHCDSECSTPGSRHYLYVSDVADAVLFLLDPNTVLQQDHDHGGATCPKFNLVGSEEIDNLVLAQTIADILGKQLCYQMVDYHSSRPGHDLRYSMSGELMSRMGWIPKIKISNGIKSVVEWYLDNPRWLGLIK